MENFMNKSFQFDSLIKNATIHCMNISMDVHTSCCVGILNQKISYIGPYQSHFTAKHELDAKQQILTPGLIDCHTHLVYAGNRSNDFCKRLQGVTYSEIAEQGGGILSTVKATQEASEDELFQQSKARLQAMIDSGVTCVEIKSGYGLDCANELKMLKVIQQLAEQCPIQIHATYLALHALPPNYSNSSIYVDEVIDVILPQVAKLKLATSVDAFCETIAFSTQQVEKLFKAAKNYGLNIKIHSEQLSNQGGAVMASNHQALSMDHLEYLDAKDCRSLKGVAVLLPGAYYFLKETKLPPIDALRHSNLTMAIATDCNPGTSPFTHLPMMMNMACILFGLTIEEAWRGVTIHAAKALGMDKHIGSIELGKAAHLVVWNTDDWCDIVYQPQMVKPDVRLYLA
jgi:imidazolonepropionase